MTYPNTPGWSEPTTSKEAAESMIPHASRIALVVLAAIKDRPRAMFELCEDLGMLTQTVSARVTELKLKGLIEYSGERRITPSGRQAQVWRVPAPKGEQLSLL